MQELRSSEILDQQIKADCKKRAATILSNAEVQSKKILDEVDGMIDDARKELEKASRDRIEFFKKNLESSVLLEKQRILVDYIYNSVMDAMNAYLENMGQEKRLSLVVSMLAPSKELLKDKSVEAVVLGYEIADAEKALKSMVNVKTSSRGNIILLEDEGVRGLKFREGIILKSDDGKITLRLTLDEKIKEILADNTQQLAVALFGGRLPE
jgi:vacuolar-type H+-ATPase subunit E/Vma4